LKRQYSILFPPITVAPCLQANWPLIPWHTPGTLAQKAALIKAVFLGIEQAIGGAVGVIWAIFAPLSG
jgi:hypothetical protein